MVDSPGLVPIGTPKEYTVCATVLSERQTLLGHFYVGQYIGDFPMLIQFDHAVHLFDL